MQVWFEHEGREHTAKSGQVLPVLDRRGSQHIVRWGSSDRADHPRLPRGAWLRIDFLMCYDVTWVKVPLTRYQAYDSWRGEKLVQLDEPMAGGLIRIPGETLRVYLVDDLFLNGPTTVCPMTYSALTSALGTGEKTTS